MTTYKIVSTMSCVVSSEVELPDGRTWDDVKEWYVKWGCLIVTFKDDITSEIDMDVDTEESIDWKRPNSTEVFTINEDGCYGDLITSDEDFNAIGAKLMVSTQ